MIDRGEVLYNRYCGRCHAFGRALLPDLRQISPVTHQLFYQIVSRWDDVLSIDDAQAIHAYLVDQAWQLRADTPAAKYSHP